MDKLEFKASFEVSDAGEITGIAWPFGSADRVGDVIEKGAFASPERLPMLFAHDQAQAIGFWDSITETPQGLQVKGRLLIDEVARAREVRALVREQAVSGLSIGFVTKSAKVRPGGGRTIHALSLHEISIVAVPSHPGAKITSMKAATDGAATQKENEMENEALNPPEVKADPVIDQKALDALKARIDKIEARANRPANNNHPNGENDNAGIEKKAFMSFARRGVERMPVDEVKALTVSVDANGGYLAPESFEREILKKLVEFSPIRAYAKVTTISASEIKLPRRLTRAATSWVAEIAQRPETSTTFEQATFTPYELSSWIPVSLQLLEDNIYNLEGELIEQFGEAIGTSEGAAFVSGDGSGKPKGLLTASGITEVKTGNTATLGTDPAATIIGMFHTLPAAFANKGVWLMNRKTLGTLRLLKDSTGRFLLVDPLSAGMPSTLLGMPVVEAIDMPDIAANAYPIVFGDLSGYRITDRIGLSVQRDPYTMSDYGQVKFTARKRVGGDVSNADRFVKLKVSV